VENVDHYIYKEETLSSYILLFAFPQLSPENVKKCGLKNADF